MRGRRLGQRRDNRALWRAIVWAPGRAQTAVWERWLAFWWWLLSGLMRNNGRQRGRRGLFRMRVPARVSAEDAEQIQKLLEMQEALGDWTALSDLGNRTRAGDSRFHIEPEEVEAVCRRILELKLPFLDLGGVLADGAPGERVEMVERLTPAIVHETTTILCPEVTTVESRWRHGELSYRPADALEDLFRLPLHERVLPPALLLDLLLKGELYVPGRGHRPRVEFVPREVVLPCERLVSRPVLFHLPQESSSEPKRIVYFLIDTSQSMRGPLAILAAAIVRAVILANLGRPRVYFSRAFAEDVEPPGDMPPHAARSTPERIALADWVIRQSFGGNETRLMLALQTCLKDIRQAREAPGQEELPAAEVILISDGRSTVLPYVQEDVRRSGIQLHVVALDNYRNADLEAIAASYSAIPDAAHLPVGSIPATSTPQPPASRGRQPAAPAGA